MGGSFPVRSEPISRAPRNPPRSAPVGLFPIALVCFPIVASHAVLFPNSNQETIALSLTLVVLAIVGPLIAGSIFGWFLFVLFMFFMIWSGQNRILMWQTSTSTHSPTFKGRVRTSAALGDARNWFPLRPSEGPSTWPLAEYMYVVTSAQAADVKSWLKDAGIWVSEVDTDGEQRARETLNVPDGHRVVWAWID